MTQLRVRVTCLLELLMCTVSQSNIISWQRLEAACLADSEYKLLHQTISAGAPDDKNSWDQSIQDFHPHRHALITVGPLVMLHDRPGIPKALQQAVMELLHVGHSSATAMFERASTSLYWPNFRSDLINFRAGCAQCSRYDPSNPAMPPTVPEEPSYPFQSSCTSSLWAPKATWWWWTGTATGSTFSS